MNKHKPTRPATEIRRFTRGDGVTLPNGTTGVIKSVGTTDTSFQYMIEPTGGGELITAEQGELTSTPALNTGKYGGPSRGGAAGGWVGGNNYRRCS